MVEYKVVIVRVIATYDVSLSGSAERKERRTEHFDFIP